MRKSWGDQELCQSLCKERKVSTCFRDSRIASTLGTSSVSGFKPAWSRKYLFLSFIVTLKICFRTSSLESAMAATALDENKLPFCDEEASLTENDRDSSQNHTEADWNWRETIWWRVSRCLKQIKQRCVVPFRIKKRRRRQYHSVDETCMQR